MSVFTEFAFNPDGIYEESWPRVGDPDALREVRESAANYLVGTNLLVASTVGGVALQAFPIPEVVRSIALAATMVSYMAASITYLLAVRAASVAHAAEVVEGVNCQALAPYPEHPDFTYPDQG